MAAELKISGERAERVIANISTFLSSEPSTQAEMDLVADALWDLQEDLKAVVAEGAS